MFSLTKYTESGTFCVAIRLLWIFRSTITGVEQDGSTYFELGVYIHTLGLKLGVGHFKI
jgi:hypothetical protein